MVFAEPFPETRVSAEPVSLPLASRYSVRTAPEEPGRLVDVPVIRPEASRVVEWTVPFESVRWSMV